MLGFLPGPASNPPTGAVPKVAEVVSWSLGTLGVGQSGERRFTVIVDAPVAAGNILLSDAEIFDTAAASNSARSTTATAVNGNPRLALSLTTNAAPVAPSGVVLHQLTATNRGTTSTSGGVTMTAFIPGSTSFAGVTEGGVCLAGFNTCDTGEAVTWSLTDLPAGASRTVGLSVRVVSGSNAPPDGALIPQQAAVTSEGLSASATAVSRICSGGGTSCDLVGPAPRADLRITKTDSPDPVFEGQPLTYTLTVRNNGPNNATGVTVTDPLLGGVTLVSATASQGTCSGTATNVTCGLGSLANGATATVTIVVTPISEGGRSNTASVAGNQTDPNLGDNSDTEPTTLKLGSGPGASAKARPRIRFAAAVVNVPLGRTDIFKLRLTPNGRKIIKNGKVKTLKGRLEVRNISGAIVSNTPITIRLRTIKPR